MKLNAKRTGISYLTVKLYSQETPFQTKSFMENLQLSLSYLNLEVSGGYFNLQKANKVLQNLSRLSLQLHTFK